MKIPPNTTYSVQEKAFMQHFVVKGVAEKGFQPWYVGWCRRLVAKSPPHTTYCVHGIGLMQHLVVKGVVDEDDSRWFQPWFSIMFRRLVVKKDIMCGREGLVCRMPLMAWGEIDTICCIGWKVGYAIFCGWGIRGVKVMGEMSWRGWLVAVSVGRMWFWSFNGFTTGACVD